MKLPVLYKKTFTGAIQYWEIVYGIHNDGKSGFFTITYGQIGTTSPQITVEVISKGKNIGKKNSTTPIEQAEKEAKARWEKQKRKGYVETIESAKAEETNALIKGGIAPMLAHKFTKYGHKMKYPAFIQPKLDGIRCIAILKDGKCTLWSRTRKPITSMPHIVQEIESLNVGGPEFILDGELYNHDYRNNFETIVSIVRQEEPDPNHTMVQYHIYDWADFQMTFDQRWRWLEQSWKYLSNDKTPHLKLVKTYRIYNENQVMEQFQLFRQGGYEGAILRNMEGKYENKRSYNLQKVK